MKGSTVDRKAGTTHRTGWRPEGTGWGRACCSCGWEAVSPVRWPHSEAGRAAINRKIRAHMTVWR